MFKASIFTALRRILLLTCYDILKSFFASYFQILIYFFLHWVCDPLIVRVIPFNAWLKRMLPSKKQMFKYVFLYNTRFEILYISIIFMTE